MKQAAKRKPADRNLVEAIVARYEGDEGMLIPMMQDLQADCGYLPLDQLRRLASRLEVPMSRLYAIATFYSSFRLAPKGLHEVTLCVGTVCYLKGSGQISEALRKEFQVEAGGTTPDGLFSFHPVNCVGACAVAPVMIVDGEYYNGITLDSARDILRGLSPEEAPAESEAQK
ncbi:MAG: NAD(P)H-dependent oxidoreductase subunit E [Phycisphaerae bacterium]|nr:NAD(P)H-dependent oxidoreductase subunit E [Phycisphaerae bacterium]